MIRYKNINGNSGVTHYEITAHSIKIKFGTGDTIYIYSESKIAKHHIDKLKKLAVAGKGLSTYISQHAEVKGHSISG